VAVVISGRSDLIFSGIEDSTQENDIFGFHRGTSTAFAELTTKPYDSLWDRGLGLSADDGRLFVVASPSFHQTPIDFLVLMDPSKVRSSLALAAIPPAIHLGETTRLSGQLTFADGGAGGKIIHLTRDNPDGSSTELADVTTNASGIFSEVDSPPSAGTFTYTARFDGDQRHARAIASTSLVVSGNGKIVFDSNRTGNFEIFTINADGSGVHQLTNNAADDFAAAWSADGSKIAFTSDRSGNYDVWTMNADGTGLTRITNDSHFDGDPTWKPDGSAIAFDSTRSGSMDIWTIDLPGGALHRRTASPAVDEYPAWSPDGLKIAFDSDRTGNFDAFTMKTDGSGVTNITNNSASDGGASWSPDGTLIAFGSDRTGDFEVWTYDAGSGTLTKLTSGTGFDGDQSFAPDGSLISFDSFRVGKLQVWVMNADGSGRVQYTKTGSVNELPDWGSAG
jgi:TolB protein